MTHHYLYNKYLNEGNQLSQIQTSCEKTISWTSPANIALIKYWGKHGNQLPDNPSISFTLSRSFTQMSVTYESIRDKAFSLEFYLDHIRNYEFEKKLTFYIERILPFMPFLDGLHLTIKSCNTFPHSAGIASSASSISALAMCLCSIEQEHFNSLNDKDNFLQKASFIARVGSGSACRSIYGGIVLWGFLPNVSGSSNEVAIPITDGIKHGFNSYNDAILVIDSTPKHLSSSAGHKLMSHHPYKEARHKQANNNLQKLLTVFSSGNTMKFSDIIENEALSLHALLQSSTPGYVLLHPNTLVVIKLIQEFRLQTNVPVTYTLDAGPNIHLLYPESFRSQTVAFIESELKQYCENGRWIDDQVNENREAPLLISMMNDKLSI
jgi:diphosphomevalonate decarboxylase